MSSYYSCGCWFSWRITSSSSGSNICGHFGCSCGASTIPSNIKAWFVLIPRLTSRCGHGRPARGRTHARTLMHALDHGLGVSDCRKINLGPPSLFALRLSPCSSSALPSHRISSVSCSSHFIGCSLPPAPMYGFSMCGIRVSKSVHRADEKGSRGGYWYILTRVSLQKRACVCPPLCCGYFSSTLRPRYA